MVENSIRKFATEKLSDDYIPVVHGQTRSLKPLILMVKQKRDLWKLPFAETEMRILAGLGEYVTEEKKEEFEEITTSTFKSENVEIEKEEEDIEFSSFDTEWEDTNNSDDQVNIKLEDDLGVLHLGHLYEEYHLDEDLPGILSKAVLDANGIKTLEENEHCLLVSSVVYSERFELDSSSYRENETRATDKQEEPSQFVSLLGKHAEAAGDFTMDTTVSGPSVPTRNTPGPFLFRVCEVYYDKGTGLLKIRGTSSEATSGHRDFETHHDNYHKYEELIVDSGGKGKVTPFTIEDRKRMENIKKLLMTVDTTEQRKRIVRQYLEWFKTILTSEQKKVTLETPLTDGDCNFLRLLYIPAVTGQKELNWQNLSDRREIHRYGMLFKSLFDFTDKAWEELQNILDTGR